MNTSIFEEYRLLGCDAVLSDTNLSFRRSVVSPASWYIISIPPKCRQTFTRLHIQEEIVLESYDLEKSNFTQAILIQSKYRVIHKSLRDFQPLRYSSRDGQAEGEHVNRGRYTPSFWPTLQLLDASTFGDTADFNPVI
jgi:hypothetical protein